MFLVVVTRFAQEQRSTREKYSPHYTTTLNRHTRQDGLMPLCSLCQTYHLKSRLIWCLSSLLLFCLILVSMCKRSLSFLFSAGRSGTWFGFVVLEPICFMVPSYKSLCKLLLPSYQLKVIWSFSSKLWQQRHFFRLFTGYFHFLYILCFSTRIFGLQRL